MIYIRVPLIWFRSNHHPNFDQLTRNLSVSSMFVVWNTNMFLILWTWGVDKNLLEIFRLFVSIDFGGVQNLHFGYLKMRFLPNAPIHLVWYIRNVFGCFDDSKSVFHLKYELHSCFKYLFQKLSQRKFRTTCSILVGRREVRDWNTNTAFKFRSWIIERYLLEEHCLFGSKAMNSNTLTN
jgi:hypothetical protein